MLSIEVQRHSIAVIFFYSKVVTNIHGFETNIKCFAFLVRFRAKNQTLLQKLSSYNKTKQNQGVPSVCNLRSPRAFSASKISQRANRWSRSLQIDRRNGQNEVKKSESLTCESTGSAKSDRVENSRRVPCVLLSLCRIFNSANAKMYQFLFALLSRLGSSREKGARAPRQLIPWSVRGVSLSFSLSLARSLIAATWRLLTPRTRQQQQQQQQWRWRCAHLLCRRYIGTDGRTHWAALVIGSRASERESAAFAKCQTLTFYGLSRRLQQQQPTSELFIRRRVAKLFLVFRRSGSKCALRVGKLGLVNSFNAISAVKTTFGGSTQTHSAIIWSTQWAMTFDHLWQDGNTHDLDLSPSALALD